MGLFLIGSWIYYFGVVVVPSIMIVVLSLTFEKNRRSPAFWLGATIMCALSIVILFFVVFEPLAGAREISIWTFQMDSFTGVRIFVLTVSAMLTLFCSKWWPPLRAASLGISSAGIVWPILFLFGISRDVLTALGYTFTS